MTDFLERAYKKYLPISKLDCLESNIIEPY